MILDQFLYSVSEMCESRQDTINYNSILKIFDEMNSSCSPGTLPSCSLSKPTSCVRRGEFLSSLSLYGSSLDSAPRPLLCLIVCFGCRRPRLKTSASLSFIRTEANMKSTTASSNTQSVLSSILDLLSFKLFATLLLVNVYLWAWKNFIGTAAALTLRYVQAVVDHVL